MLLGPSDPLRSGPRRIVLAGVSGVGKSTFAQRIAAAGSLPYTEIDALYHGPEWVPLTSFLSDVETLSSGSEWVTEWQYRDARPLLTARADLLVWLDLPRAVSLYRVIRRTIRRSRTQQVLWNGNTEPGVWHALTDREGIIRWAVTTRGTVREERSAGRRSLSPASGGAIAQPTGDREVVRGAAASGARVSDLSSKGA